MNNNYSQSIPKIGLGTYNMTPEEAEIMTFESIKHGYRHIDTAAVYRNEEGVAKGFNKIFKETQLQREDIFITTKLWPGGLMKVDLVKSYDGARKSFEKSMLAFRSRLFRSLSNSLTSCKRKKTRSMESAC
jgi:2,5-diketo-D-gluconate reductase A